MYQSYFSYKLERKYPLRWFTWVAVLGGLVLTALFTIINFATNGFFYTTDPNGTMAQGHWYNHGPFSLTKTPATKCDFTAIPIGMKVFSDKMTLPYELSSVEKRWNKDNSTVKAPSLIYLNNTLYNCEVGSIEVDLDSIMDSDALTLARVLWNPRLSSRINCSFGQDDWTTGLELSVSYNPSADSPVIPINQTTAPSLWWSWGLLQWYSVDASKSWREIAEGQKSDTKKPVKGHLSFKQSGTTQSVEDRGFFNITIFIEGKDSQIFAGSANVGEWMDGKMAYSSAASAFDSYAKSFYSFLLADLGQNTPSIANNATALEHYTKNFTTGHKTGSLTGDGTPESYRASEALFIDSSTLYAQYFCQEPKLKSTGSLFVAVLLADLVFLSAAWTALNWGAAAWVGRRDENSMHCAGCAAAAGREGHELETRKPPSEADVPLLGPGKTEDTRR